MPPCSAMPLRIDAHGVLADAEVQHPAVPVAGERLGGLLGGQEATARPSGVVLLDPARSAEPPQSSGSTGRDRVRTSPDARGWRCPCVGVERRERVGPAVGQAAGPQPVEQRRRSPGWRPPGVEPLLPGLAARPAAVDAPAGVGDDVVGDVEGLRRGRSRGPAWSRRPRRRRGRNRAPCRCSAAFGAGQAMIVRSAMKRRPVGLGLGRLQGGVEASTSSS